MHEVHERPCLCGRMTLGDCAGECGEPERESNEKEQSTMQANAGQSPSASDFFGEPISTYTRAEALDDGVLVDVSQRASEAGFVFPVALTTGVWADVNDIPESKQGIQDVEGRLWDLLFSAAQRCKAVHEPPCSGKRSDEEDGLPFDLIMHVRSAPYYHAKVHLGPGDEMEPVITILRPEED